MIKVISFDIGGTLLKSNEERGDKYSLKALTELLKLPHNLVRDAYKDVFQKNKGTFEKLVSMFCNKLNIQPNDEINTFFKNKFSDSEEKILASDLTVLRQLKEQGYKIILFSNSCCLIKSTIKESVKNIVDDIFYSFDLGYTKSDKESYKFIENKMGYRSNEFLHIGDTLKSDYLKPIENGWNALYYGKIDDLKIKNIIDLREIFNYLEDNK